MAEDISFSLWEIIRQWGSPSVAAAAAGLAYRFGRANESVKQDLEHTKTTVLRATAEIDALKIRTDAISSSHSDLRTAVAALPTRHEMMTGISQIREDIRDLIKRSI